jgi:hypothetical protein
LDDSDPRIFRILSVVAAIKKNAPDDIHMAQRYATLLDILVSAATRLGPNATRGVAHDEANQPSYIASYLGNTYNTYLDSNVFNSMAGDSIYDPNFWDSLPDMVGLDNMPNLFMPAFN